MAKDDTASVIHLHQPRPKTSAERGRAFRERQRKASALRVKQSERAKPQPVENPPTFETFANGDPTFAALEESTARLIAACQKGIDAARALRLGRAK
jgi:hypothetical protein